MAIKAYNNKYLCGYCYKEYTYAHDADSCKSSHKLIYIPFSKEDLNRLVIFIYSKEDEALDDKVVERLQRFLSSSMTIDTET